MSYRNHNVEQRCIAWFDIVVMLLILTPVIAGAAFAAEQVREPILAGRWYPADPNHLESQINQFIDRADIQPPEGNLIGLIVPHAGYIYSGQVAAHAYKLLKTRHYATIVVIAPSHRVRFNGVSVYDRGGYRTPLGLMPLDHEFIRRLQQANRDIRHVPGAHTQEHSLEIQLPFLQVVAPGSRLVPLVMGEQSNATCRKLADSLVDTTGNKPVLIIASTDLSHFHSYAKARELDDRIVRHVRAMDPEGLLRDLGNGTCEACGGGPMAAVLMASKRMQADISQVMSTCNSGDVTGDRSRVVGYMAASLWRASKRSGTSHIRKTERPHTLSPSEKALLHEIARQSIEARFSGNSVGLPGILSPPLREPRGAFVTLRKAGRLRGCIGHVVGRLSLAETVSRMAVAAAFQDPRFKPVGKDELDELEYEISAMTPLEPLGDVNDLVVGTHGIYIRKGERSGLLLPQVATEYGWQRRTFLEQTCRKAGLPKNAWQDPDTRIFIFSAEVF